MKIGVKTFDDSKFLKYFEDKVDFVEIMAIKGKDYSFLKYFSLSIIIHAEHHDFGINPADYSIREKNIKSLNFARRIADLFNSDKIIAHPGILINQDCSLETSIDFFRQFNDNRILIENLPIIKNFYALCKYDDQIEEFLNLTNKSFCFDVNHAIGAMKNFQDDYDFIKKYIRLNPKHYHIGGQKFSNPIEHFSFLSSDLDLEKILRFYPKDAKITLETEFIRNMKRNIDKVEKDIEIIREYINDLNLHYYFNSSFK